MLQADTSKFSRNGFEGTQILGNINWNIMLPLSTAQLSEGDRLRRLDTSLAHELNNIYLMPPTREVTIGLWELQSQVINTKRGQGQRLNRKNYIFTVPDDWPYGMNLWQLLISIESWFNWAIQNGFQPADDQFGGFYIGNGPNHLQLHTWH